MMQTYESLSDFLDRGRDKNSRPWKPNTRVNRIIQEEYDPVIQIKLHDTVILNYLKKDSEIVLNSGGWRTQLTKERINEFIQPEFSISQGGGIWFVHYRDNQFATMFFDGFIIPKDFESEKGAEEQKKIYDLKKQIDKYAKEVERQMLAGEMDIPNNGDCWYCIDRERSKTNEHLLNHLNASCIIPTLIDNALKENHFVSKKEYNTEYFWYDYQYRRHDNRRNMWTIDSAKRSVKRYLKRRLGIAY